ncbi:hypothetical protein HPB51_021347 [Rhipicephalus microplus]|uniref:HTH psq-type domain-containing protein n=1 Tax=Rhipicephalus microplus TaxID=6941 RepID=A0A9J6F7Z2_RHIMP|nr:hypothetical protein HPB51_021347 [Rhipicephalus microplus]
MNKELSMLSSASRASIKRGKYVTISMAKKAAIIKLAESGRLRADAAKELQISKQTLLDYIKNKQKIWEAAEKSTGCHQKNVSQGTYPKIEEALLVRLKSTVASKVSVSEGLLKQKAEMMALQMNIEGFKSMTSTMLHNCFRHAGFELNGESAVVDEDSVVDQVLESKQLIDDLRTAGVDIPSDVSFSEFACVDSELELCTGLTDEEIICLVLAQSESDDDDDNFPATTQTTQAELMQALATLSSAYSDMTTPAEMRADVLARKRSMVQKRINNFFRPPAQ